VSAQVTKGPHQGQPVLAAGTALDQARAAMILVHGRGATAQSMLTLAQELPHPDTAFLAPQAAGHSWYPYSFMAPIAQNEPGLSSGLARIGEVLDQLNVAGIPSERIILLGFSQGACLVLEFAARHAQRYGGVVGLSGGLIGLDGTSRDYAGSLDGTSIFLGCSEADSHIPQERIHHSAAVLERLGGQVTKRLYPNLGHSVNQDELAFVRNMVERALKS
jgi:phospholipase/carboxylesterase